jgi:hypothetical protein
MRIARLGITLVAAAALVPLSASAAFAAPPGNDTPDGAVSLTLGQTYKEDTTKATTDSQDADLNQVCGAPFTNASVWFTYDAAADGTVLADMTQSDYTGGFMIFEGAPTQDSMLTCGPQSLGFEATKGTSYTIVAFSDTEVNGGNLVLSLDKGPPAPKIKVTVDDAGWAFKDGSAQLTGTYVCKNADFLDLQGQLTQIWKRLKIQGFFFKEFAGSQCDGRLHSWKRNVVSDNGLYAPGAATVSMFNFACGPIVCAEVDTTSKVTLHKSSLLHAPQGTVSKAGSPARASVWDMQSRR